MKKRGLIFFIFAFLIVYSGVCRAYDMPDYVRVGIENGFKEVSSVPIGNNNIKIGIGHEGDFSAEAELLAESSFSVNVPSGNIIDVNEFYGSYEDALDACADIEKLWGYAAVPAFVGEELWGVYICGETDAKRAAGDVGGKVISDTSSVMVLKDGGKDKIVFNGIFPQIAASEGNTTAIGSRKYRGVIEFGRYGGGNITAVNVLTMDEYLYGVVPSEMPSSWEIEALKAQAVAARTYTASYMGRHSSSGYDVCDNVHCQAYLGYDQEKETTNRAVDETSGEGAYYDGKLINAVFFASSGGATDDGVNVWVNDLPYLKGVPEINETGVGVWTRTYTASEMESILAGKGINIGNIIDIEITKTSQYGRVLELTITGTEGTKKLEKEETRTIFSQTSQGSLPSRMYTVNGRGGAVIKDDGGKISTPNTDSSAENKGSQSVYVKSSSDMGEIDFDNAYIMGGGNSELVIGREVSGVHAIGKGNDITEIEGISEITVNDTQTFTAADDKFIFEGKGNGHGVGMSQYGANGMAAIGYKYDEILKYYYTGITVE